MRMKENLEKGLLSIVEKVVRLEIQKNDDGNLPICPFVLHQPKRPKKQAEFISSNED